MAQATTKKKPTARKKSPAKKKATARAKPVQMADLSWEMREEKEGVKKHIYMIANDGTTLRLEAGIRGETGIVARRNLANKIVKAFAAAA